jgi:predicted secreted Zn-dependent protease
MLPALSTSLVVTVMVVFAVIPPAAAGAKVTVKTQTYDISGDSGRALVRAMDRTGPRHGFMTRAIAQTSYTVDWDLQVRETRGVCKLARAVPTLHLTYIFPKAKSLSPGLSPRWKTFLAGVHKHERRHGRIATDMVKAAAGEVSGITVAHDPSCNKARREARGRIDAVYARYEARQVAFDKREHQDGGRVEKLVDALMADAGCLAADAAGGCRRDRGGRGLGILQWLGHLWPE